MLLAAKSPSEHRFISEREKAYLIEKTKDAVSNSKKKQKTPWLEIMKSKVFWSLAISQSASHFGTYLFLTQLPTYMREILKFDIKSVFNLFKLKLILKMIKFFLTKEWWIISFALYYVLVRYYIIKCNWR